MPSAITANCRRERLPSMDAFFSTTMERLRIERLIPCDRNAPDSASSVVPPSAPGRSGAGPTAQVFPAFHDSHVRADNRPNGSEAVKEILTREEDKNDEIYLHQN